MISASYDDQYRLCPESISSLSLIPFFLHFPRINYLFHVMSKGANFFLQALSH